MTGASKVEANLTHPTAATFPWETGADIAPLGAEWVDKKVTFSGGQLPQLKFRIADSEKFDYCDNHAFDCGNRIVLPESHFWEAKVRPRILQCFSISKFWSIIKQFAFQWYQGWLMIKILCVESYRAASNDVCLASSRAIMVMEHSGGLCYTLSYPTHHTLHTPLLSCLQARANIFTQNYVETHR